MSAGPRGFKSCRCSMPRSKTVDDAPAGAAPAARAHAMAVETFVVVVMCGRMAASIRGNMAKSDQALMVGDGQVISWMDRKRWWMESLVTQVFVCVE